MKNDKEQFISELMRNPKFKEWAEMLRKKKVQLSNPEYDEWENMLIESISRADIQSEKKLVALLSTNGKEPKQIADEVTAIVQRCKQRNRINFKFLVYTGIALYILNVFSSAVDSSGLLYPNLVLFSGTLNFLFILFAAFILWKIDSKFEKILSLSLVLFPIFMLGSQTFIPENYIIFNLLKITDWLLRIYTLFYFWNLGKLTNQN